MIVPSKAADTKRANLPRPYDYTKEFAKDRQRVTALRPLRHAETQGRHDAAGGVGHGSVLSGPSRRQSVAGTPRGYPHATWLSPGHCRP
jgi:hypothetical protein